MELKNKFIIQVIWGLVVLSGMWVWTVRPALAAPMIGNITDSGTAAKYEKFEITFGITNSVATNFFFPYDPLMPTHLESNSGITVNAQFLPPGQTDWAGAYTIPAFYYQDFDYQQKINESNANAEWMYPNGNFAWKARLAPNQVGTWQYRLTALDASGSTTSTVRSFTVNSSTNHGFIRASKKDSRYFEFEDGTYFPGLGYNLNFSGIDWTNPVLKNQDMFAIMKQNGIQLTRMWQSQWAIFGSYWNPWHYLGDFFDYVWLTGTEKYGNSDNSLYINYGLSEAADACVAFGGWNTYTPAVKPNTTYRLRARVKTAQMGTARSIGSATPTPPGSTVFPAPFVLGTGTANYGLVIKSVPHGQPDWLDNCANTGNGQAYSNYLSTNSDWTIISGTYTTAANQNFMPMIYVGLENITQGKAYLDYFWMEQDLGNGNYGPNIIAKPWMSHYQYVDQRNSFAFDKMLDLAHQNDVYLKVVGLEKNDFIPNHTDLYTNDTIADRDSSCINNCFYGARGQMNKVYFEQRAWWRYQQARWGYSTNIHSWELLNEGDPGTDLHYVLTNNYATFMHQFKPNDHMVTTSFWSQYPAAAFWANPTYSSVDYADVHRYIYANPGGWEDPNYVDTAMSNYDTGNKYGAKAPGGAGKPVIRGETGLYNGGNDGTLAEINADTQGLWLHNFIWGQVNPGGVLEQYWYITEVNHIYGAHDLRPIYGTFYRFIKDLPLNNGNYVDAAAQTGNTSLRAWGQKDLTNKRAHLWISNAAHTWKNQNAAAVSGTVTVAGFTPNASYTLEWWNTYTGAIQSTTSVTANSTGVISLNISSLATDTAVKIGNYSQTTITPTVPAPVPGDANGDGHVDGIDYVVWLNHYNLTVSGGASVGDFTGDGHVDGVDYVTWLTNYGK